VEAGAGVAVKEAGASAAVAVDDAVGRDVGSASRQATDMTNPTRSTDARIMGFIGIGLPGLNVGVRWPASELLGGIIYGLIELSRV
jgi:hypothetical protein